MTAYNFATITAAQALAFDGKVDQITTSGDVRQYLVSFDDAAGTVRITDPISLHAVVFGAGFEGAVLQGDVGLLVGTPGADFIDNASLIMFGGSGNDTLLGGGFVRGGPGSDLFISTYVKHMGQILDWETGDRLYMSTVAATDATITGGAGADNFHGSQDAGVDRVLDFNPSEGDRVQLDPGTTYTLKQVGLDAVLDMGNGNQLILVGVFVDNLHPGWVFGA